MIPPYTVYHHHIKVTQNEEDENKVDARTNTFKVLGVPKDQLDWITLPYAGVPDNVTIVCEDVDIRLELARKLQEQTALNVYLHDNHPIIRNYFKNALQLGRCGVKSIRSLDWCSDRPILFCGAGKSLVHNLDTVRDAIRTGSHTVIAGGSANRILATHKIYPHFSLCFDPNSSEFEYVFKWLDDEYIQKVPLIATTGLDHACFMRQLDKKGMIYVSQSISLPALSKHLFPNEPLIEEGCSSVSTMIPYVAHRMLDNPSRGLEYLGVDLMFSEQGDAYGDGMTVNHKDLEKYKDTMTRKCWIRESHGIAKTCYELGLNVSCGVERSLLLEQGVPYKKIDTKQEHSDIVVECIHYNYSKAEVACKLDQMKKEACDYHLKSEIDTDTSFYQCILKQYYQLQDFRMCRGIDLNQCLLNNVTDQAIEQMNNYLEKI